MGRMDQGFRDLLAEVGRLIGVSEAVRKRMESEEFHEGLDEINRRMSDLYDCVIGAIGVALSLDFVTVPVPGGEGKRGKERLSLNFKFGGSPEDQEMKKEFSLDEQEMNDLLERARRERDDGKGKDSIVPADAEAASQPPEEAVETVETAESPDPRSASQIINSIREAARALNSKQRQFVVLRLQDSFRCLDVKLPKIEQLKKDVVWLQVIQDFVSAVRRGEDAILSMSIILSFEQVLLQLQARGS